MSHNFVLFTCTVFPHRVHHCSAVAQLPCGNVSLVSTLIKNFHIMECYGRKVVKWLDACYVQWIKNIFQFMICYRVLDILLTIWNTVNIITTIQCPHIILTILLIKSYVYPLPTGLGCLWNEYSNTSHGKINMTCLIFIYYCDKYFHNIHIVVLFPVSPNPMLHLYAYMYTLLKIPMYLEQVYLYFTMYKIKFYKTI